MCTAILADAFAAFPRKCDERKIPDPKDQTTQQKIRPSLPADFANDYLCIHVRRGDYVNIASHLVSAREFFEFAGLVKHIVVVSDSSIEESFRQRVSAGYKQAAFLDVSMPCIASCVLRVILGNVRKP